MAGIRVGIEVTGIPGLLGKLTPRLYSKEFTRALESIGDTGESLVHAYGPHGPTGLLGSEAFHRVQKKPVPRWLVIGTKALATPYDPGSRGGITRYPYAYPRRLEYDPQSKRRGWMRRVLSKVKILAQRDLREAERNIEINWGRSRG